MDLAQDFGANQPNDSAPKILAKTKTETKLRTAVLVVGGLAVLAAAAVGILKIDKSGDLNVYREYDSPPAGTILYAYDNSQHTLFSAGFYPGKEDVKVSKITFTILAEKGFKGNARGMFKNMVLYRKVYSYGYGYGYNYTLEPIGKINVLSGSGAQVKAQFNFSSPLLLNVFNSASLVLVSEIPANAPEGNFSVQIANANDITAVGAKSNRKIKANIEYAKGDWLTVKKNPPVPVFSIEPSGAVVRGKTYNFSGKITGALPNSKISFYLQRPDGTMLFNGVVTPCQITRPGCLGQPVSTDSNGVWQMTYEAPLPFEGQNGTWVSWVIVGDIESNKVYFKVIPSGCEIDGCG